MNSERSDQNICIFLREYVICNLIKESFLLVEGAAAVQIRLNNNDKNILVY